MVCTGCCATLDHIVTYLFKQLTQKGKSLLCLLACLHLIQFVALQYIQARSLVWALHHRATCSSRCWKCIPRSCSKY